MPYIKQSDRVEISSRARLANTPGELNFLLTSIANSYLAARGRSYATFNDVIGALECAKLEMYRRLVAPYEDRKMIENGDVYSKEG
jgi:hypothetical protein